MMITFKQFLSEDVSTDIQNLQLQITNLQARKGQQDKTIDQQIVRLQTLLASKQQQQQVQAKTQQTKTN